MTIQPRHIGPAVVKEVATYFGLHPQKMYDRDRHTEVVRVRWAAMYALRIMCGMKLCQIAEVLELDHTTVMYGVDRQIDIVLSDPDMKAKMTEISRLIISKVISV